MDAEFNETTGNLYDMFIVCSKTVFAPVDSSGLFGMHMNLRNINFNDWFNTSLVTNMAGMFSDCYALSVADFNNLNTSSVTNMHNMFFRCSSLTTTITIHGNVGSYSSMFSFAATAEGAKIIVNYTSATSSLVDSMIATKSSNSNVVKGSLVS